MTPPGEEAVYFNQNSAAEYGSGQLAVGEMVWFSVRSGDNGQQAVFVQPLGKRGTVKSRVSLLTEESTNANRQIPKMARRARMPFRYARGHERGEGHGHLTIHRGSRGRRRPDSTRANMNALQSVGLAAVRA